MIAIVTGTWITLLLVFLSVGLAIPIMEEATETTQELGSTYPVFASFLTTNIAILFAAVVSVLLTVAISVWND